MRAGAAAAALAAAMVALWPAGAMAVTDLGRLLAPAPSFDWIEFDPAADILEGPFTAKSYAAYVQRDFTTPVTTEADLNRDGFVAGYGREWEQLGTRDYLQERVFQFRTDAGAAIWYEGLRRQNETSTYFVNDIPGLDHIPDSFGVVVRYETGTGREARVEFAKANLMFIVHMGSGVSDLSSEAVHQAQLEYDGKVPASIGPMGPIPNHVLVVAGGIVIAGVLLVSALVLVLLIIVGPWRRPPIPAGLPGAQLSPDRRYWWDGTAWRPTDQGGPGGPET